MSSPATYTPPTREQIYQAFLNLVSAATIGTPPVPAFNTTSRRLRDWSQVSSEEKPSLYQIQVSEDFKANESGMPYVDKLNLELYIFVAQNDDTDVVSSLLNPLVDSLIAAMQQKATDERQTLGGLVYNVMISGPVEYREGLLGPNAFAVIPIRIFTGGLQPDF
jgi:hypothetical protein